MGSFRSSTVQAKQLKEGGLEYGTHKNRFHPKGEELEKTSREEKTHLEGEEQLKTTTTKCKNHPKKLSAKTCGWGDTNLGKLSRWAGGGRNKAHLGGKKAAAVSGWQTIIRSLPSRHPGVSWRVRCPHPPRATGAS